MAILVQTIGSGSSLQNWMGRRGVYSSSYQLAMWGVTFGED